MPIFWQKGPIGKGAQQYEEMEKENNELKTIGPERQE